MSQSTTRNVVDVDQCCNNKFVTLTGSAKAPDSLFHVRDGWEPLCKFLNVPVPNKPFPHRNKGGEIVHEFVDKSYVFKPMRNELFAVLSLTVLALCVVIIFCRVAF